MGDKLEMKNFRIPAGARKDLDEILFKMSLLSGDSADCILCNEEKRGQSLMIQGHTLPVKGHMVPDEKVKEKYESLGITISGQDSDFYFAELPDNIEIVSDENVFWSTIRFKEGADIARIFCKKAFMMVDTKIYFL